MAGRIKAALFVVANLPLRQTGPGGMGDAWPKPMDIANERP